MSTEDRQGNPISSYVLLGELRAHYLMWDPGWQGRPAVLLHGLASNARIWELTAPHLLAGGLFPIALDQRGHGLSDKPDGDFGFDAMVRDLASFLERCNVERPLLVGHSWGAMVALDYAARVKAGSRAPAGLVLVDGAFHQLSAEPGATWEATRDRLTPPRLAGTRLDEFLTVLRKGGPGWMPDEAAVRIILANFTIDEEERISPHLAFDNHMKIVRAMWDFQTYEKYAQVSCPVLAIPARPPHGVGPSADFLRMKERGLARIQEIRPELHIEWMQNTVHDIPLQRPAELARSIAAFSRSLKA